MTRKSRVFSALAIAAAGALMITTTAYQSKAADGVVNGNYHIDEGTGYAGGEVAAVTGLNTTSTGTFRYDAPGTDEDIEIASGDIKSLENAVKALSAQVTGLGDTAKAADMALDTGAATAIGNLGTTNSTAMGQIKGSIDTLTQQINTLNESLTSSGSGANGAGTVVKTDFGYVNVSEHFSLRASDLAEVFLARIYDITNSDTQSGCMGGVGPSKYVMWSGNLTEAQLKTATPVGRFAFGEKSVGTTGQGTGTRSATILTAYMISATGSLTKIYSYTSTNNVSPSNPVYTLAPIVE